ncbi:hypothetical protein [Natronorubrum texcoconense]|uniref:hypothetical protein n=1 Tax=Natronorubrum texcoconense TaxID=1095776 RepID=UPI001FDF1E80|nr:hypothetical protein [Natronorubrum texcoconense]
MGDEPRRLVGLFGELVDTVFRGVIDLVLIANVDAVLKNSRPSRYLPPSLTTYRCRSRLRR